MSSDVELTRTEQTGDLATQIGTMAERIKIMAADLADASAQSFSNGVSIGGGSDFFIMGLTVFVLACFVGYYVVWRVTPALHSPLMGITNAISSVIIVGAILAAGPADGGLAKLLGFLGITLASVNIFGGFIITRRMLSMFKKKGA